MTEWRRFVDIMKELERRHESAKLACMSWLEGKDKAAIHLCYTHWVHYKQQQDVDRKHMDLQTALDTLGDRHLSALEAHERRHEAARISVEYAIRKWEMGCSGAMVMEVFDVLHKYCMKQGERRRKQVAVQLATEQWLRGDRQGLMHVIFYRFHALAMEQVSCRTQRNAVTAVLFQFLEG